MFRKFLPVALLGAGLVFGGLAAAADVPTLHQVYQAAQGGKLDRAQAMMKQVIAAHPDSAKAHFVEAELLAKQGRMGSAGAELAQAQKLDPGLPFAKPQAVAALSTRIASTPTSPVSASAAPRPRVPSLPWGAILLGVGGVALLLWFMRAMRRTTAPAAYGGAAPLGAMPGTLGPQPYMGGGMGAGMGGVGGGGGLGSNIVSGLATGAAVGAGIVAGEALVNHFMHGNDTPIGGADQALAGQNSWDALPDNMGGTDFGVSDPGSWDDNSGLADNLGGDDWS